MSRAEDWAIYLKNPDAFDQDHFAQSLVDSSPEYSIEPEFFFSFTPQTQLVVDRLNDLKNKTDFNGLYYLPRSSERITEEKSVRALQNIIKVTSEHARIKGDLDEAGALNRVKTVIVHDIDEFHQLNTDITRERNPSFSRLNDSFQEFALDRSDIYFAVLESVLNMTTYPMVRNYLINPAVKYPFEFRLFYDLFIGGAAFTEFTDEIVLYVPQA